MLYRSIRERLTMVKRLEQSFIYIGRVYFLKPLRASHREYTGLSNYTTVSFDNFLKERK